MEFCKVFGAALGPSEARLVVCGFGISTCKDLGFRVEGLGFRVSGLTCLGSKSFSACSALAVLADTAIPDPS